jgi:hypothetical protein
MAKEERFARPQKDPSLLKAITRIMARKYSGSYEKYGELPGGLMLFTLSLLNKR